MIDIHSHIVPRELPFGQSGDARWPTVTLDEGKGRVEISGKTFRVVREVCWNMDARLEEIGGRGIQTQVISPMPELLSYWAPVDEAAAYCSAMNVWIAARVEERPERLVGLGIVPMQDVERAAEMLASVKATGLAGVEIGSTIGELSAGHSHFSPFYIEAARLGLSVFIHAFHPLCGTQVPKFAVNAVTFPLDIGLATEGLIVNKILASAPTLRVAVSHGGGAAAFAIARLQYVWENNERVREELGEMPSESIRRIYYDSILLADAPLRYLLQTVGTDRVCVGTDFPFFGSGDVLKPVRELQLDPDEMEAVFTNNARRYLGFD